MIQNKNLMAMNRSERRRIGKLIKMKIPGSTKPSINPKKRRF